MKFMSRKSVKPLRNIWLVARREYTQRVRTPAFLITTILIFVLLVAGPLVPGLIASNNIMQPLKIAVADATASGLVSRLQPTVTGAMLELVPVAGSATEADLTEQVRAGEYDAFAIISGAWPADFALELRADGFTAQGRAEPLARAIIALAQADRAAALGIDPQDAAHLLVRDAKVTVGQLTKGGVVGEDDPRKAAAGIFGAVIAMSLIYAGILLYGALVLQGVLEEKTSRVMEVMASSVRPFALMAGKILGLGLLGLTSYVSWLLAYVVLSILGASLVGLDLSLVSVSHILHLGAFFIGGYFLYAAMFAAAGSLISRIEDAGAVQTPAMLLVVVALMISMLSMQSPDSTLAVVSSFIPFFSPTVMLMRLFMGEVPAWQIAVSYLLLAVSIVAVTWLASRIYRVGILSYGSRPTMRQVLRFLRS